MSDVSDLSVLLQIEARALEAQTLAALRFTIVNETHALTPYRQAALFDGAAQLFVHLLAQLAQAPVPGGCGLGIGSGNWHELAPWLW